MSVEVESKTLTGYPSLDKPWLKYYSADAINAPLPECTVFENIWSHNKEYLSDIALEYYGQKISYRKLFEETERTACALRGAGVKCGDCVALCTAGVPEAVYLVLACSHIGAVANFINPMFTTEQMIDRINDTGADLIFVLDAMYKYIADAIDKTCAKRVVIIPATGSLSAPVRLIASLKGKPDKRLRESIKVSDKYICWRDFIKTAVSYIGTVDEPYEKDRPTVMVYSSGTTGASKGIQLTNDGINATIIQYKHMTTELSRQMSFLHIVPIWFSTGISICLLMPLCLGMRIILDPVFSRETFASDLAKYKPNFTLGATSLWLYATEYKPLEKLNLSFLKYPITGGEQLLPRTEEQINAFLEEHNCHIRLATGWGMCELGATVTSTTTALTSNPALRRPGTAGIPIPFVSVAAFNVETGEELTYGERGELRVATPCRMSGYYKNPEATTEFFKKDSQSRVWGCTGDMGFVDEDGFVYVLGRMSDCYSAESGEKVYFFDVENVILQDETVELCKVVDVEINGHSAIVAHLVLRKDCEDDWKNIIRRVDKLCREKLPVYALPSVYKLRTGFPVKPSGKRDVEALRQEREGYIYADGTSADLQAIK